jgi:hypothetical protein
MVPVPMDIPKDKSSSSDEETSAATALGSITLGFLAVSALLY